ncbi:hypothetical protein EW145_g2286 [Phellinidium pouzarii]|uniref:Uncharacterized protein n=1 Tax=Phellinidium pouzarii TaxID=167371 RepID=A0A4S4LD76_9AGAM|nr:hypothetical protein EW145_g2286 [Phellinidium pouzarii]
MSPREALSDLTNDVLSSSSNSPTRGKRRADDHNIASKRAKLTEGNTTGEAEEVGKHGDVEMLETASIRMSVRRCQPSVYASLHALRLGDPTARRLFSLPTISILESFVSSNGADLFKCQSLDSNSFLTPPYACAYSNASKRGQGSILAIATEQGTVDILSTAKRRDWDPEGTRITLQIHNNGIFDVKWSPSDSYVATASGDRSICITDPQSSTGTALHNLNAGHSSTVKCVTWDPLHNDLLASGGRDGCICLWDLRVGNQVAHSQDEGDGRRKPVMSIPYAHEIVASKPTKKGRVVLAPRSVTSLAYLEDAPYEIISSGSGDGIIRKWDLRLTSSSPKKRGKKPASILPIDNAEEDLTTLPSDLPSAGLLFSPRRARGIISMALGMGPSAGRIFALSNDSRVHTYNTSGAVGIPLSVPQADQAYTHRHMATNSFYVRTVVSPCGRWLASGGAGGSAFLFDISVGGEEKLGMQGVELKGQEGEVGAVDWADGALATCADDGTVRIWRPDIERYRMCMDNPVEAKWDWTWGKM